MRPGLIIGIVVVVAVVIAGVFWFTSEAEQTRIEEQRTEQAAQTAREQDLQDDRARDAAEQAERNADRAAEEEVDETAPDEGATAEEADEAKAASDDLRVIGDEITNDTTVVESATDNPVILEPDNTTTTIVDDTTVEGSANASETDAITEGGDNASNSAGGTTETGDTAGATTATPDQLLTPANFDRDKVLALIDSSDQLSSDQRSTLSALVEGANSNPAMTEAAIRSIRSAIELPPLE